MIQLNARRILIPMDFSPTSLRAIRPAIQLAKRTGGELMILHVRKSKDSDDHSPFTQGESVAKSIREEHSLKVTVLVTHGKRPTEISKAAKRYEADLIVMGTEGGESYSSMFFGSNASRVITKSGVPVISVRSELPSAGFSRILLPIDDSAHTRQKVNVALKLASLFDAEVHVLGFMGKNDTRFLPKLRRIISQIKTLAGEWSVAFFSTILETDSPARKALAWAKSINADLIVTMTDESGGSDRFAFGSFDKQLVDESPIAVLSIHPEIHEENIELATISGLG